MSGAPPEAGGAVRGPPGAVGLRYVNLDFGREMAEERATFGYWEVPPTLCEDFLALYRRLCI